MSYFIVFEGLDGVGKSTVLEYVAKALSLRTDKLVQIFREPGGTDTAELLRSVLKGQMPGITDPLTPFSELLLFAAARCQNLTYSIAPALENDSIVLVDRFYLSTLAYQGYGLDCGLTEFIHAIINNTIDIEPDLHVFIDATVPTVLERARQRPNSTLDRIELRGPEFFERARRGFQLEVANKSNVVTIDGEQSLADVCAAALAAVCSKFDL